jgi:hypothetical protein
VTRGPGWGYDVRTGTISFRLTEARVMGDKSPKNTSKTNKQKSQKKDAKATKK